MRICQHDFVANFNWMCVCVCVCTVARAYTVHESSNRNITKWESMPSFSPLEPKHRDIMQQCGGGGASLVVMGNGDAVAFCSSNSSIFHGCTR